ncbi:MAG: thiamine pyrophosphate-dependent enzyme, partial [Bermanella sp.]
MRRAIDIPEGERARADIVAPMIRDVGLALAMGQTPIEVFAAQMGKSGSYMDGGQEGSGGRDLHIGNWEKGVLPPTAPLPIASATTTGIALAASRLSVDRFHLAPVGEGCSSNGEFWEAMNLAGARGLPISFMIQNNQIALDTFVTAQSGVETYGDKGHAMGMPAWTMDGSDPGLFYASTAVAREFATAGGGPTLIHVETMRGCGHAHHHDDLYLGAASGNPPGYVDRGLLTYWAEKDPLPNHRELLIQFGADDKELESMEEQEQASVDAARDEMMEMPWPEGNTVTRGVTSLHDAASHAEQYDRFGSEVAVVDPPLAPGESSLEFSEASNTWTYSRAIQNGMVSIAEKYGDRAVFMGEDMEIAGAFGMMLSLIAKGHSDKLLDMPLSESVIVHSATGAALGGMRPVAEIQFCDYAFNTIDL